MTLGNMREQGVCPCIAYCHNDAYQHPGVIDVELLAAMQKCSRTPGTWRCSGCALARIRGGSSPRPRRPSRFCAIYSPAWTGFVLTTGSTFDNSANLAPTFIEAIKRRYEGARLGRQELHAELLTDTPGALWNLDQLDATRLPEVGPNIQVQRVVVAIDPAVSTNEGSDETGVVVAARDEHGHFYVFADLSGRYQPQEWAAKAVNAYRHYMGDALVIEVNQGVDMAKSTLRNYDRDVPIRMCHASRGKVTRAEPISALYEQGRVHHVGTFAKLEIRCAPLPATSIAIRLVIRLTGWTHWSGRSRTFRNLTRRCSGLPVKRNMRFRVSILMRLQSTACCAMHGGVSNASRYTKIHSHLAFDNNQFRGTI